MDIWATTTSTASPAAPLPRKRRVWLWLAAAIAVLAIAGAVLWATGAVDNPGKDPGVAACESAASRAADGSTATAEQGRAEVDMLKASRHEDLRAVGAEIERVASLRDAMKITVQMASACAAHGVIIKVG